MFWILRIFGLDFLDLKDFQDCWILWFFGSGLWLFWIWILWFFGSGSGFSGFGYFGFSGLGYLVLVRILDSSDFSGLLDANGSSGFGFFQVLVAHVNNTNIVHYPPLHNSTSALSPLFGIPPL